MTSTQLSSRRRIAAASSVALLRHSSSLITGILARRAVRHEIGSPGVAHEFRVLGPLEVLVDGTPVPLGGPRQRALLALLLAQANEVVPVDRLIDGVWGDDPPETAGERPAGLRLAAAQAARQGHHRHARARLCRRRCRTARSTCIASSATPRAGMPARADGRAADAAARARAGPGAVARPGAVGPGRPAVRPADRGAPRRAAPDGARARASRRTSTAVAQAEAAAELDPLSPSTRCASACERCACWRSTAADARPRRSTPSAPPARRWWRSWASSPGAALQRARAGDPRARTRCSPRRARTRA